MWGYADLLEMYARVDELDPEDEEYERVLYTLGEDFNPADANGEVLRERFRSAFPPPPKAK